MNLINKRDNTLMMIYFALHIFFPAVIDDENTNVVTAGAIVTVTVTLVRSNMSELFGNADVAEKQGIK